MNNWVVIITGGAQGIGKATAFIFAREGAHVFVGDINETLGQKLEKEWTEHQTNHPEQTGTITFVKSDAASLEDCTKLFETALKKNGRIDVLFNNVGIQPNESNVPVHMLSEELWDQLFTVNIKSFFRMVKLVLPVMMKQKKGSIIHNSSIQGIQSQSAVPAYAATKGAILSFSRQLAMEYGSYNIRSNVVCPGSTLTPLLIDVTPKDVLNYITSNTPLGHVGEPNDIGEMVAFLASDKAKWITGQTFVIDGGITSKGGWCPLPSQQ